MGLAPADALPPLEEGAPGSGVVSRLFDDVDEVLALSAFVGALYYILNEHWHLTFAPNATDS